MKNIYLLCGLLFSCIWSKAQNTQIQFINNSADSVMQSVKVFADANVMKDSLDFQTATSFLSIDGDTTYTIKFQSKRDTAKSISLTQAFQAGKKYVLILNGVTNDTAYLTNPDGVSTQLRILSIEQSALGTPTANEVLCVFVHGSTDAPTFDVYAVDTLNTLLIDNDSLHQVAPTTFENNFIKFKLKTADGNFNISTYMFDLSVLGGQTTTLLISGFLAPGSNSNGANFTVFIVDSLGNFITATNVSTIHQQEDIFQQVKLFPNPASDFIQVNYTLNENSDVRYQIISVAGNIVQQGELHQTTKGINESRIAFSNLNSGMYLLRLQTETGQIAQPFIVK